MTSASETIPNANGWTNPFRYDGRDGVRYDTATGLYWMRVRAYDPTIGRFLARDPLGRAPLFFADQPYAYAGNNPVSNVDPSGQRYTMGNSGGDTHSKPKAHKPTRVAPKKGAPKKGGNSSLQSRVLGMFGGCSACASLLLTLLKHVKGPNSKAILMGVGIALGVIGMVLDFVAIYLAIKQAGTSPDVKRYLEEALEITGFISLALDTLSFVTNFPIGGAWESLFQGIGAILSVLISFIKWAIAAVTKVAWYLLGGLRAILLAQSESGEGELAPIDVALTALAGAAVKTFVSGIGNMLIAAGLFIAMHINENE